MPRTTQDLDTRLKKFKIEKSRYISDKAKLNELGFSDEQAQRILLRKSQNSLVCLTNEIEWLRSHFSIEQITKILGADGGSRNIAALKQAYKELITFGFTTEQIVKIVGHNGGSRNISAVKEAHTELQNLGFTAEQIVKIVGHNGGSRNIYTVKAAHTELKALGFTAEQIVKIVGHDGGSKNIAAVKEAYTELKALGFTAEQIVKIAGHDGGSKNIAAVKEAYTELKAFGFTAEQIVKIAGHDGGSRNIAFLRSHYTVINNTLTTTQIMRFLNSHKGKILATMLDPRKAIDIFLSQLINELDELEPATPETPSIISDDLIKDDIFNSFPAFGTTMLAKTSAAAGSDKQSPSMIFSRAEKRMRSTAEDLHSGDDSQPKRMRKSAPCIG